MPRPDPRQLGLFGPLEPAAQKPAQSAPRANIGPAAPSDELRRLAASLPPVLRLGTSSWSFPGWAGFVYDRIASEAELARNGLAAYALHPLFRLAGIDRTFYAPLTSAQFAEYSRQIPPDFQFLVKAYDGLTSPKPFAARGGPASRTNPHFLDAQFATDQVIAPFVEGLADKCGPLVFQFVPLGIRRVRPPDKFLMALHEFLVKLPKGPLYAVELRNAELLTPEYNALLADSGVVHCYNVHPSMPPVAEQAQRVAPARQKAIVVRWMLHSALDYQAARDAYAPFDRIVDEDLANRAAIAALAVEAAARNVRVYVTANNKAEGSAPWTIARLAQRIAAGLSPQ